MFQFIKVSLLRQLYRLANWWAWREQDVKVASRELQIPGPGDTIAARVYTPAAGENGPIVLYFHGGGWVISDLNTHDPFCRALSDETGCVLVAVEYRLAPENPFPAAHDDCLAAARWLIENMATMAASKGSLVIAGDSAGGNLAIATCLQLSEAHRSVLAGQVVLCPVVEHYRENYPSYRERDTGHVLTSNLMRWFWDTYAGKSGTEARHLATALPFEHENLHTLPPTLLVTAEFDPLRDEGLEFGRRCEAAGIIISHLHAANSEHGFTCSTGYNRQFGDFTDSLNNWLRALAQP